MALLEQSFFYAFNYKLNLHNEHIYRQGLHRGRVPVWSSSLWRYF